MWLVELMVTHEDCEQYLVTAWAVALRNLWITSAVSWLRQEQVNHKQTRYKNGENDSVLTSTTLKVVTVKLTLLFSPMFGTTCWTTGAEVMFSMIPVMFENICVWGSLGQKNYSNIRWHVPSTSLYPGTQTHWKEPMVFTQAVLAGQMSLWLATASKHSSTSVYN